MNLIYLFIFLCNYAALHIQSAKHGYELIFENFTCTTDDKSSILLKTQTCGLNKSTKRRSLNLEISFKEDLRVFDFYIYIVFPRRSNDFELLNITMRGCQMLSNKNVMALIEIGRQVVNRYSNFPKKCPFLKNKIYYIRGFRLDLELIPAIEMETPVYVHWRYQKDKLYFSKAYVVGRVVFKNNSKNI